MDAVDKPTCFVIFTIGADGSVERRDADSALKHFIRKALSEDFIVKRGDEETDPGAITPTIIAAILDADLVVADLSSLNANVFYELAVAHAYGTPTVLVQRTSDKIPFDVKDMRTVKYDVTDPEALEDAQKTLRKYAKHAMDSDQEQTTPISSAARRLSVTESSDPVAESNVQLLDVITNMQGELTREIRRVTPSPVLE